MQPWYRSAYRRVVVDMHISDHHEDFISQFSPEAYVEMLQSCGAQSTVLPAHSHVGLCYYPTEIGPMHPGLDGRDVFGEVTTLCHKHDIAVVGYISGSFDTRAYRQNPDWRIIDVAGNEANAESRYGICCPNSPYRDYVSELAREVCGGYDIDGVRYDMTFWPRVCYCQHCQQRFDREIGGELPRTIDWTDPAWVSFQRRREQWLLEFAELLTTTAKDANSDITVEHQSSTYTSDWSFGVTAELADKCDFLQGDFYGGALEGSFVRKLFRSLSGDLPYAFETSVAVNLGNHTTVASEDLLTAKASACFADGGAFVFIDAIDPKGTLNPAARHTMNDVFDTIAPYEGYIGGEPVQDVAVYLSTTAKCSLADNGRQPGNENLANKSPHVEAAVGACQSLKQNHIPFGVITEKNLHEIADYSIVVLPNVLMMSKTEAKVFRRYVREGGNLYASGHTSLISNNGDRQNDFMLGDVFGVRWTGQTDESYTYLVPAERGEELFEGYTRRHPAAFEDSQVTLAPGAEGDVIATLGLPYFTPPDANRFASIHSNPPGRYRPNPAITLNRFDRGQCVYSAADIERRRPHSGLFLGLLHLMQDEFSFESDGPNCVEITAFRQPAENRYIISLVNFQKQLPNVGVHDMRVRLRLGDQRPVQLLLLPHEQQHHYTFDGNSVEFIAPPLDTLLMFSLQLR